MNKPSSLSLLVIDDEQLLAERVIEKLRHINIVTHMAILDEQKELTKALRRKWDVILYGKAYDLTADQVIKAVQAQGQDVPVVVMLSQVGKPVNHDDSSDVVMLDLHSQGVARTLLRSEVSLIALAIADELSHLAIRRRVRKTKNMLEDANMRTKSLLKNANSAVAYLGEGVHVFANQSYVELFGFEDANDLLGLPIIDLIEASYASKFKELLKQFMKGDHSEADMSFKGIQTSGKTFDGKLQFAPANYDGENVTQIIIQPEGVVGVTGQMAAIADHTDGLTGLGSRQKFEEDLAKIRASAIKQHTQHGLLYVSIDNIGQISASMGIKGTDTTIMHVAELLKKHFSNASISRFSDAAFTIIINNIDKEGILNEAQKVRQDIADDLINVGQLTARTTVSIGMVLINETSPDTSELFSRAYDGIDKIRKQTHGIGNDVYLYDPYVNATSSDSALFETVNSALDKNMFKLLFQPIYNVDTDASNFYEVYLRLPLPDGTTMTPDQFLEIAEKANMLERLDRWVMLNATKVLRRELKKDPSTRMLINLSKSAIQDSGLPEFANKLNKAIGHADAPIILQFSEQDVNNYLALAKQQFELFERAGCRISINNFGSSLKSLDLFDHVEPNMVKLDRSYAKNLTDAANLSATQSFVSDIKDKNVMPMVAFIEDAGTMSAAWSVGAPYLQGMYLQEPKPDIIQSEG